MTEIVDGEYYWLRDTKHGELTVGQANVYRDNLIGWYIVDCDMCMLVKDYDIIEHIPKPETK